MLLLLPFRYFIKEEPLALVLESFNLALYTNGDYLLPWRTHVGSDTFPVTVVTVWEEQLNFRRVWSGEWNASRWTLTLFLSEEGDREHRWREKQSDSSVFLCEMSASHLLLMMICYFPTFYSCIFIWLCVLITPLVVHFWLYFLVSVKISFCCFMCVCYLWIKRTLLYCNHLFLHICLQTFLSMLLLLVISFYNVLCCGRM